MVDIIRKDLLLKFVLAGRAIFTAYNEETGNRFTFKVKKLDPKKSRDKGVWFVSVMTGTDNENHYTFIGSIFEKRLAEFKYSNKSKLKFDSIQIKAFTYVYRMLFNQKKIPDKLKIMHSGHCAKCGRTLTVPESIKLGFGPNCAKMLNIH